MLKSPFHYDDWLKPEEFQLIGTLLLRWSHIEHIIGNCLKGMLRLSDEEAVVMVFKLSFDQRVRRINELAKLIGINADAKAALAAFNGISEHLTQIRNNVVHAIIVDDGQMGKLLHLRSKMKYLTLDQLRETEEFINYAAHIAISLRYAIGWKGQPAERHPLPDKPKSPDFLSHPNPIGIRLGRRLPPRP